MNMKTQTIPFNPFAEEVFAARLALGPIVVALWIAISPPISGQEYEYEPGEGLHQEEWYDPSDWVDTTEGVDYEDDWSWEPLGSDRRSVWYDEEEWRTSRPASRRQQDHYQAEQRSRSQSRSGVLQGRIASVRLVTENRVQGRWGPRTQVRLRLDNGNSAFVDLGYNTPEVLQLEEGARVRVQGRTHRAGGREVLIADRMWVNGIGYDLRGLPQTAARQSTGNQRQAGDGGNVEIRGQLEAIREMSLDDARQNHTLARVRLQNGRSVIVDLGRNFEQRYGEDRFERLLERASQGDNIYIRGTRQSANGRNIIRANQLRLEGRNILGQD